MSRPPARDLVVIGGHAYTYNCQLETVLTLSGGSVATYDPSNP